MLLLVRARGQNQRTRSALTLSGERRREDCGMTFLAWSSSPVAEQDGEVEGVYLAVTVKIGGAAFGWIGAWSPGAQQEGQIEGVYAAVKIEICGVAVAASGRAGRIGGVGPGLQKERPVVAVGRAGFVHIGPGAASPAASFGREALLEKVQIVGINLPIRIEVTLVRRNGPVADIVPAGQIRGLTEGRVVRSVESARETGRERNRQPPPRTGRQSQRKPTRLERPQPGSETLSISSRCVSRFDPQA